MVPTGTAACRRAQRRSSCRSCLDKIQLRWSGRSQGLALRFFGKELLEIIQWRQRIQIAPMPSGSFIVQRCTSFVLSLYSAVVAYPGLSAGLRQDSDAWIRRYEDAKQMADDALAQIQVPAGRALMFPGV